MSLAENPTLLQNTGLCGCWGSVYIIDKYPYLTASLENFQGKKRKKEKKKETKTVQLFHRSREGARRQRVTSQTGSVPRWLSRESLALVASFRETCYFWQRLSPPSTDRVVAHVAATRWHWLTFLFIWVSRFRSVYLLIFFISLSLSLSLSGLDILTTGWVQAEEKEKKEKKRIEDISTQGHRLNMGGGGGGGIYVMLTFNVDIEEIYDYKLGLVWLTPWLLQHQHRAGLKRAQYRAEKSTHAARLKTIYLMVL